MSGAGERESQRSEQQNGAGKSRRMVEGKEQAIKVTASVMTFQMFREETSGSLKVRGKVRE